MLRPFLLSVGIRVVDRESFLLLGGLAKGAGGQSGEFAELTAEVFDIVVAAAVRDLTHGIVGIDELLLGQTDSSFDDILHTGGAEGLAVDELQVAGADVESICHRLHGPVPLGIVHDLLVQLHQVDGVRSVIVAGHILVELLEKNTQKIFDDQLTALGRVSGLPGEKLEQAVDIFRVRYGEGKAVGGETGDKAFITAETQPVVGIFAAAGSVVDLLAGLEQNRGVGGTAFKFPVHPETGRRVGQKQ